MYSLSTLTTFAVAATFVGPLLRPVDAAFTAARMTYYDTEVGLGSCGYQNRNSEYVVAMNVAQYKLNQCNTKICISYKGKSVEAKVVDLCPSCAFGNLDLTDSLFKRFEDLSVGVIRGATWDWGGCGSSVPPVLPVPPQPSPTKPKKKTTTTKKTSTKKTTTTKKPKKTPKARNPYNRFRILEAAATPAPEAEVQDIEVPPVEPMTGPAVEDIVAPQPTPGPEAFMVL
ncbi:hypothetical protein HDU97_005005 [Phlyctochytrium planicorne]|nr:hypothetical protein HDU97_005005 [Phlyctochytrium planicorne]